jgi:hypothetical protein
MQSWRCRWMIWESDTGYFAPDAACLNQTFTLMEAMTHVINSNGSGELMVSGLKCCNRPQADDPCTFRFPCHKEKFPVCELVQTVRSYLLLTERQAEEEI